MNIRKYILPIIVAGAVLLLLGANFTTAQKNSQRQIQQNNELLELGKINNTYHRANSCIITMDPSMRTEDYKSDCYDRAEKITGVKVERFNVK